MARWAVTFGLLALSLTSAFLPSAYAEGDVAVEDDSTEAKEAVKADAPADETVDVNSEEGAQKFMDSANELNEKLGQLKALLAAKGDSADPALKDSLASLEKQLGSLGLGLDSLTEDSGSKKDLQEFLVNCIMMSIRRLGARRPSTMGALRQLASGKLKVHDRPNLELVRMTAVCINELTDDELQDFKLGKPSPLPKHLADKASKPEAREMVTNLEVKVWDELELVAKTVLAQLGGDDHEPLPYVYGVVAGVPVLIIVLFLTRKLMDMQKEKEAKQEKKDKKKSK